MSHNRSLFDYFVIRRSTSVSQSYISETVTQSEIDISKEKKPKKSLEDYDFTIITHPFSVLKIKPLQTTNQPTPKKIQKFLKHKKVKTRKILCKDKNTRKFKYLKFDCASRGTEICKNVFIGSAQVACNTNWLKENKIKKVINVTPNLVCFYENRSNVEYHYFQHQIVTLRVPVRDESDAPIEMYFDELKQHIDESRSLNENVFVHCEKGLSRSACVIVAYLMMAYQINIKTAEKIFKERFYHIALHSGFYQKLSLLEDQNKTQNCEKRKTRRSVEKVNEELVMDIIKEIEMKKVEE
ncbi:dual specificity protein phosphatase, putative [Entamoeba invadens IP1]|uniref:protein-tyrosine-phosphatase n=1 Tax=Entamoeba invadens IP1 TaxID=370355 RepID=A0A0A1TV49_ENTIV|nr:dual specificity protein phosphatase, putative [Entamoeba invadens IP1]ELP84204.1 dual specificity protein phosphatase, putative [Entamoeba invadens IP1]|eukprot:XP_004183550.1 dual specificity protein phosphatase, putative [Entamoeba invadens IP1]